MEHSSEYKRGYEAGKETGFDEGKKFGFAEGRQSVFNEIGKRLAELCADKIRTEAEIYVLSKWVGG